jgi:hypothetical protein
VNGEDVDFPRTVPGTLCVRSSSVRAAAR